MIIQNLTASLLLILLVVAEAGRSKECKRVTNKGAQFLNGGYENLRILIDPTTVEDKKLLTTIANAVSDASHALFTATDGLAYFRDVKVIVPFDWAPSWLYENGSVADFNPDGTDMRVELVETGRKPNAKHFSPECGREGLSIELAFDTKQLGVQTAAQRAINGKELAAAWAEHRYGVFPEHWHNAHESDTIVNFPFDPSDSCEKHIHEAAGWLNPKPTSCGALAYGDDGYDFRDTTGAVCNPCDHFTYDRWAEKATKRSPPDVCSKLMLNDVPSSNKAASLMFATSEEKIFRFCDDETHNGLAISLHNFYCQMRPIMDVIKSHPDFGCGSQSRPEGQKDYHPPRVHFLKNEIAQPIVYVLDTSGSMIMDSPKNRLMVMQDAMTTVINDLHNGAEKPIAIVEFSSQRADKSPNARIVHPLANVTDITRKQMELAIERMRAEGATPIGSGILKGIEALGSHCKHAKMMLVGDGEENEKPFVTSVEVQNEIRRCNISIDTMLISDSADRVLTELSRNTSGSSFYINPASPSWKYALPVAIAAMSKAALSAEDRLSVCQLESTSVSVPWTGSFRGTVLVDATVRRDTIFQFRNQDYRSSKLSVRLCSPNWQCVSPTVDDIPGTRYDDSNSGVTIRTSLADVGIWTYDLSTNGGDTDAAVTISVTSASVKGVKPIMLRGWYSTNDVADVKREPLSIYARLTQGSNVVVGAAVSVRVITGGKVDVTKQLRDDGTAGDYEANDGIYSMVFTAYDKVGRYSSVFSADDNLGRALIKSADGQKVVPSGAFHRVYYGELVEITDPAVNGKTDFVPPGKIEHLFVVSGDVVTKTATLVWHAPGDDGYEGTASSYTLVYSNDARRLVDDLSDCDFVNNVAIPLEAGHEERANISLARASFPIRDGTVVYFVMLAIDERSNRGLPSNIARVTFHDAGARTTRQPTTERTTRRTSTSRPTSKASTAKASTTPTPRPTSESPPPKTTPEPTAPTPTPQITTETREPITETPEITTPKITTPKITTPKITTPEVTTPERTTTPEITTQKTTTKYPTTSKRPTTTAKTTPRKTTRPEPTTETTTTQRPKPSTSAQPPRTTAKVASCHDFSCLGLADGDYADANYPCADHYCACTNGIMYVMPCAAGLYFYDVLDKCVGYDQVPACKKQKTSRH